MNIEFEHELDIEGFQIFALIEAEASCHTDDDYGADADGNRGETRHFVDDLKVKVLDGSGKDITDKLQERHKHEFERVEDVAAERILDTYMEERMGGW